MNEATTTLTRTDPNWAYGLPELGPRYRDAIRTKKRIAVPGCHASGFNLIMPCYPNIELACKAMGS